MATRRGWPWPCGSRGPRLPAESCGFSRGGPCTPAVRTPVPGCVPPRPGRLAKAPSWWSSRCSGPCGLCWRSCQSLGCMLGTASDGSATTASRPWHRASGRPPRRGTLQRTPRAPTGRRRSARRSRGSWAKPGGRRLPVARGCQLQTARPGAGPRRRQRPARSASRCRTTTAARTRAARARRGPSSLARARASSCRAAWCRAWWRSRASGRRATVCRAWRAPWACSRRRLWASTATASRRTLWRPARAAAPVARAARPSSKLPAPATAAAAAAASRGPSARARPEAAAADPWRPSRRATAQVARSRPCRPPQSS